MTTALSIKDMPERERPYEKLETLGPGFLSDAELLAIIIKSGSRHEKSTDLALRLLKAHPSGLLGLHHMSMKQLQKIHGIGRVKAIQLKALAELAKRMSKADYSNRVTIGSPSSVAALYMEEMRHMDREHLKIVILDTKHRIIGDYILSIGTVNSTLIQPREVFIHALKRDAVTIIMLHNHPSGNPEPSPQDLDVTKRIRDAGDLIGVRLLDHIIIGDGRYVSMKELGYMT